MKYDVKKDREKFLGGSDIGAIMGLSPFKTRYELLLEKAGLVQDEFNGNKYTEYGDEMEGKIREYINEKYGANYAPDRKYQGEDIRYHADGADADIKSLLEIKTTSHIYADVDDYLLYLVQLLKGMEVYGYGKGILAVYERPADFSPDFDPSRLQIFEVKAKDYKDLIDDINGEIDRFRHDLARLKENPLLTEEDFQPKAVVELSKEVAALEVRMAEYKDFEKHYKDMKQKLYEAMVSADVKSWRMINGTRVTRVDGTPATAKMVEVFDVERFKEERPDEYKAYTKEVIKETAGRSGYARITLPKE